MLVYRVVVFYEKDKICKRWLAELLSMVETLEDTVIVTVGRYEGME